MSAFEETVKIINEIGMDGLAKALPNLSIENKKVLASVLNELQLQKSIAVDDYNPEAEKIKVVDLEVETQTTLSDEDEESLIAETAEHGSQGDKTPAPLESNVAKSIDWVGKNLLSTNGKFHVDAEPILFAEPKEPIKKSQETLSDLEKMIVNGEDKNWVQVQQQKREERLNSRQVVKTQQTFTDQDMFDVLNLDAESAKKILGE